MFGKRLSKLIRARFPYIYVTTYEEDRITSLIKKIAQDPGYTKFAREIYLWTQTKGFVNEETGNKISGTASPLKALDFVEKHDKNAVFIMYDFHINFGVKSRNPDFDVIRRLRDLVLPLKTNSVRKNIIFIAPDLVIPELLQKDIAVHDFPLPDLCEIKAKLDEIITQNTHIKSDRLTPEDKDKLCKAAMGLTLQEAENAFALAMVNDGQISIEDLKIILDEKMQVIKKTGILEFVKSDYGINDIGGLENLKNWLKKRNNAWSEKAKSYCVPAPKGILITGVPGCGKSLTAKAMSKIWQLPLLRLDLGKIFSGLVGSSEENMRRAIATAEAVAPSILWIDEIEKGLSGIGSNNDSGVSSRIFGTFLTWMQEKESPVFVIATANNIRNLPSELLRKGRFDEIFFVDIPTFNERAEIFKLHLTKRLKSSEAAKGFELNNNLFTKLADLTEGFIGAEIEQVVISALYEAFFENRTLEFKDLEKTISNTVALVTTQQEQILALREWANVRAVAAAKKEDLTSYLHETEPENITSGRGGRALDF
ncbi:MAG: AAA family ATPase [Heliobacteriaceae bacterium]|jgi:ATP-dependent 26S proteasome regulatory subunit|nr:AAA family ATPase [Heliobacteriaceae bacterium]